jgi:hypothetical protein
LYYRWSGEEVKGKNVKRKIVGICVGSVFELE